MTAKYEIGSKIVIIPNGYFSRKQLEIMFGGGISVVFEYLITNGLYTMGRILQDSNLIIGLRNNYPRKYTKMVDDVPHTITHQGDKIDFREIEVSSKCNQE